MEIDQRVEELREALADRSLREGEELTGINRETLRRLLAGEYEAPQPETLRKVSSFLEGLEGDGGPPTDAAAEYRAGVAYAIGTVERALDRLRDALTLPEDAEVRRRVLEIQELGRTGSATVPRGERKPSSGKNGPQGRRRRGGG